MKLRYARALKEVYPGCRYEELEGAGHGFRGRDDEKACGILMEFARDVCGTGEEAWKTQS